MNNQFEFDSLIKKMAADHQPELPSPGLIWWRAQILRKQAQRDRIERPATIMRMVASVACVLLIAALWMNEGTQLLNLLNGSGLFDVLLPVLGGAALMAVFSILMWRITARA